MFDLAAAGYRDPILVAATDGVGTKLKIALDTGLHDSVGIDLVAMCVNDLIVQGAQPLFFLDYFATGKLDPVCAERVIAGIAEGCRQAGCALIGGETAEMPGMYSGGDYDLAGFSVGAAERGSILTGETISDGDMVLGLGSSGVHSNGFSLVRKIIDDNKLTLSSDSPFSGGSLGEALITPTRIYVQSCLAAHEAGLVKGLAHITGGGLLENIPRVLPDGLGVTLTAGSWEMPAVFPWLAKAGAIAPEEMARTFNCGVGMVVIVDQTDAEKARTILTERGEEVFEIGSVHKAGGGAQVEITGMDKNWPG